MIFWTSLSQEASNGVVRDLPATRGRSLFPTTPVFPAEGAFKTLPLGGVEAAAAGPGVILIRRYTAARLGRGAAGGGRLLAVVGRPAHNLYKGNPDRTSSGPVLSNRSRPLGGSKTARALSAPAGRADRAGRAENWILTFFVKRPSMASMESLDAISSWRV